MKLTDLILKMIEVVIKKLIENVDWNAVWFHGRMWYYKCHFDLETKSGFCICRFAESFLLNPWGYCIVGFRETRFTRVVGWVCTANL